MKVLKGFKALEYILNNKDKKLYNRKGQQLYYSDEYGEGEIMITGKYQDILKINDKTMSVEWYSEDKVKVLLKIYINGGLYSTENHYVFNVCDNINKLKDGILVKYKNEFKNVEITIDYEIYSGEIQ